MCWLVIKYTFTGGGGGGGVLLVQGSKLTVVRLSQTTKNVLGQPNNAQWLPKGQPVVSKILYVFSPTSLPMFLIDSLD